MKNKTLLKLYYVFCLDDNKKYGFLAENAYNAMQKMIYTCNLSKKENCIIKSTKSKKCLYFEHNNKTYSIINK